MLSLILTYRNRELDKVKNCLDSLEEQSDNDFQVLIVDYGSETKLASHLEDLCRKYNFIHYHYVPVQGQLWNKSRAINIALKDIKTSSVCIADVDLLFHPHFVVKTKQLLEVCSVAYFKTGFLSRETKGRSFFESEEAYAGNKNVTGISLFRTEVLKAINGYDEFYHGWGAEDTDVHLRLKNAGHDVHFYDEEIMVKHQWHPKEYRTKKSTAPFHSSLERINHQYMLQNQSLQVNRANRKWGWGIMPETEDIKRLEEPELKITLSTQKEEIDAFLTGIFPVLIRPVFVTISHFEQASTLKNRLKKFLKRKHFEAYDIETVNNALLSGIITHHRLSCYYYSIDWYKEEISLSLVPYVGK